MCVCLLYSELFYNYRSVYDGFVQAAGTVVTIRQMLKTRFDHVPDSNNSYLHIVFLAHAVRFILVQEVCYVFVYL